MIIPNDEIRGAERDITQYGKIEVDAAWPGDDSYGWNVDTPDQIPARIEPSPVKASSTERE